MIVDEIKKDLDFARKNKEQNKIAFLSSIYADVLAFGKNNGNRKTTDAEAIKILKNFQSKTEEVINLLKAKDDSKVIEYGEKIALVQKYIPVQLTEDELKQIVASYVNDLVVVDKKSMGVIMKRLKDEHDGTYDGKLASSIVRSFLA